MYRKQLEVLLIRKFLSLSTVDFPAPVDVFFNRYYVYQNNYGFPFIVTYHDIKGRICCVL
jgi:hypothetical protein